MRVQIERVDDPRLADFRDVRDAELVKRRGVFIAEGTLVVRRLLQPGARFPVRSVLLSQRRAEALGEVLDALDPSVPVCVAPQEVMDDVVGFPIHRGVLASGSVEPTRRAEVTADGPRTLLVLEGLANHDNVGGAFRNAAALGAGMVLLDPTCADPLYRKAIRVSIGTTLTVPWRRLPDWPEGLGALRAAGYTIVALSPRGDAAEVSRYSRPAKVALLIGTEGRGLSEAALDAADVRVKIPMAEGVDSLNAATAAAVALHALNHAGA